MADDNTSRISQASVLMQDMEALVKVYENGKLSGPGGLLFDLSSAQITQLKQVFASKRSECIDLLQAITG